MISFTVPVSVIIPCYDCGDTIDRAIVSVSLQSRLPAEVIIVDDGSSGECGMILEDLSNRYAEGWIRIIKIPINSGAGAARNVGWDAATQPFIAFLDSDDSWHRKKIQIQYEYMSNNPDVMFSGHRHRRLLSGHVCTSNLIFDKDKVRMISKTSILLRNPFITPSIMIRKHSRFRFDSMKRYMEDHFLWMELILSGSKASYLDLELAYIYKPPIGASGLSSNLWLMEKGELSNYRDLFRKGYLPWILFFILSLFSLFKYIRRIVLVKTSKDMKVL
jgi:glycosyltransferase involved in cell wall biosynthesis